VTVAKEGMGCRACGTSCCLVGNEGILLSTCEKNSKKDDGLRDARFRGGEKKEKALPMVDIGGSYNQGLLGQRARRAQKNGGGFGMRAQRSTSSRRRKFNEQGPSRREGRRPGKRCPRRVAEIGATDRSPKWKRRPKKTSPTYRGKKKNHELHSATLKSRKGEFAEGRQYKASKLYSEKRNPCSYRAKREGLTQRVQILKGTGASKLRKGSYFRQKRKVPINTNFRRGTLAGADKKGEPERELARVHRNKSLGLNKVHNRRGHLKEGGRISWPG